MNTDSQCKQIIHHMAKGHRISKRDAIKLCDCYNLPGRIYDIRMERTHKVVTEMVEGKNGKRHAEYFIPAALPKARRAGS